MMTFILYQVMVQTEIACLYFRVKDWGRQICNLYNTILQ